MDELDPLPGFDVQEVARLVRFAHQGGRVTAKADTVRCAGEEAMKPTLKGPPLTLTMSSGAPISCSSGDRNVPRLPSKLRVQGGATASSTSATISIASHSSAVSPSTSGSTGNEIGTA